MPAAAEITTFEPLDSPPSVERLGTEITELCTYIYAATYRLLVLIREFDEAEGWAQPGLCSCAHWLNFKCGIGMNAAREKVRVAHALKDLPKISAAFEKGTLSYSKVRAMTRIANSENEDYLLMIGRHGTAHHVEKLVQKYRRAKRLQDVEHANEQHRDRYVEYHYDEDGCLVISARLPAEQGALVVKALEKAVDADGDVTAVTSRRLQCDCSMVRVTEDENGEPLSIGRKTRTIPPAIRRALRFRDQGCRFPGCTHSRHVDGHHVHHWADGGETSLDNLVQLCRFHHRLVHEGGYSCERTVNGVVVFISPDRRPLPLRAELASVDAISIDRFDRYLAEQDIHTCVPEYYAGDRMDWDLAVANLFPSPGL